MKGSVLDIEQIAYLSKTELFVIYSSLYCH